MQHFNATFCNIVAWCCDMCWVGWPNTHFQRNIWMLVTVSGPWHTTSGPSTHALVQQCAWTWPNEYNIMQHPKCCTKNMTVFKFEPTSSNTLQHIPTVLPNVCNMLCRNMLQDVPVKILQTFDHALTSGYYCLLFGDFFIECNSNKTKVIVIKWRYDPRTCWTI